MGSKVNPNGLLTTGLFVMRTLFMITSLTFLLHHFLWAIIGDEPERSSFHPLRRIVLPFYRNSSQVAPILSQYSTPKEKLLSNANQCHTVHKNLNSCSTLPNYFLYEDQRPHFDNSVLNFWHVQKAGGSSLEQCLIGMNKGNVLSEGIRTGLGCEFKLEMLSKSAYFKNESYRPIVRGHDAIGTCDFLKGWITERKCSTFAIFRDPIEREISFYHFVREVAKSGRPHCEQWDNAWNQTIGEWIRFAGSVMYEAFFNEWEIFLNKESGKNVCKNTGSWTKKVRFREVDQDLLDLVDNLDKHLSVVGLLEDLPSTHEMFEEVYGLPFTESCSGIHQRKGEYGQGSKAEISRLKEKTRRELTSDEGAMKLLEFDFLIYDKVKEIFQKQKDIYYEMKKNRTKQL